MENTIPQSLEQSCPICWELYVISSLVILGIALILCYSVNEDF